MSIQMVGIDHTKASIDVRTVFSFTKKNIAAALEKWKEVPGLSGCVVIATCNRMELWASVREGAQIDLFAMLCTEKGVQPEEYLEYAVSREGREAVSHLFEVSCGLHSRVLGDDQIITQVKDALTLAREQYATDNVLEVLFRMAVTAAKKVKTNISLTGKNRSAIHLAVETLKNQGCVFEGKRCMVIGNGEMGKLSAMLLTQEGADVTVTVRQYRSGVVDIPRDCKRIGYADRMSIFPDCDYVVSATASPNFTLHAEDVRAASVSRDMVLIDLAVPRDIDPEIGTLPHMTVYDIDYFGAEHISEKTMENIKKAKEILCEQMQEFFDWYEGRDVIEMVQQVKAGAVQDFHLRTQKQLKELLKMHDLSREDGTELLEKFQSYMEAAAGKVVNKMMFGLRGEVDGHTFRECMEALEKIYG